MPAEKLTMVGGAATLCTNTACAESKHEAGAGRIYWSQARSVDVRAAPGTTCPRDFRNALTRHDGLKQHECRI